MKLEAVNIKNFRSIQEVTLEECGGFNVIVGKNNAGKSNILRAIDIFFKSLKRGEILVLNPNIGKSIDFHQQLVETPIEITMSFQLSLHERNNLFEEGLEDIYDAWYPGISLNDPHPKLSVAVLFEVRTYTIEVAEEEFISDVFGCVTKIKLYKSGYSTIKEDTIFHTIFEVDSQEIERIIYHGDCIEEQPLVPGHILNLIEQIGETNVLYLTERREPIGKREAEQLFEIKNTRKGVDSFKAIKEIVTDLLGIDIEVFKSPQPSTGQIIEAEIDIDKFIVEVNGAGILEALRLILDYELNQPDILLIEEPEIHLHPALETIIMRYLKSIGKNCQIFITTHSTNFLDTAEMKNVYLVSRKGCEGSTNIQLINGQEAEESIPRELGIRLSSLFMYDRLVFVEGESDEKVIREWASICGVNLAQASVGFVSMGGVRNFTHYATKHTLEFLCKRRVLTFFMLDHDELGEDEIKKLNDHFIEDKDKVKDKDKGQLKVLKKRELENYLLCPRAIAEFIKKKYRLGETGEKDVDVEEIKKAIDICADELKDETIQRRVKKRASRPVRLDHKAFLNLDSVSTLADTLNQQYSSLKDKLTELGQELEKIIAEETMYVDTNWETSKLDIVPGDMLLDNLCQLLGKQFNKVENSVTLASDMKENEIDSDYRWRFNKVKDSARLASYMKENEIDSEIKNILANFAGFTSTI
jgi:predicted ATP-dependent endonuclease of OLD family